MTARNHRSAWTPRVETRAYTPKPRERGWRFFSAPFTGLRRVGPSFTAGFGRRLTASAALLLLLVLPSPRAVAAPADTAAFDAILDGALKTWRTPGVAAVIVRDDEVIYLKGAGVRERGKDDPVTPETLFGIGSLTKAFTATAVAQLVDDGAMNWDDPVRKHLPAFRLADPLADRDVTLRDLLCHRTGLVRHDLLWRYAPWSLEESVRRMAYLKPSHSFRSVYEYNNLGYIAAGLAVGSASKSSWREDVQKRLLDPLGMTGAVFTRSAVLKAADHASPHRRNADDKIEVLSWYNDDDQVRGSGSIKAGVRDLGRWLRFQLAGGVLDGKRYVSASALAETHAPQIVMPLDHELARLTETTQMSYGFGWRISDYRGKPLWDHGGAVDGFRPHPAGAEGRGRRRGAGQPGRFADRRCGRLFAAGRGAGSAEEGLERLLRGPAEGSGRGATGRGGEAGGVARSWARSRRTSWKRTPERMRSRRTARCG